MHKPDALQRVAIPYSRGSSLENCRKQRQECDSAVLMPDFRRAVHVNSPYRLRDGTVRLISIMTNRSLISSALEDQQLVEARTQSASAQCRVVANDGRRSHGSSITPSSAHAGEGFAWTDANAARRKEIVARYPEGRQRRR